jgi:general secretion pathway protein I
MKQGRFDEAGFTLLEMLVAMAVLSIAALALVRLDAYAVRAAGDIGATGMAQIVASNEAIAALTDPTPPTIGAARQNVANAGNQWQVERRVQALPGGTAMRIDITASGNGGRATVTVVRGAGG